VWLYQWAEHARAAFVAQPALLESFMHADFGLDRMVDHIDAALGVLMRQGFTAPQAQDAYAVATECAIGAAVADIRTRELSPPLEEAYDAVLADRDPAELPHVRAVRAAGPATARTFQEQLATVLAGVAVRRGEDWQDVVARVNAASGQP
jgi:hypothetical protein